jgi:hypothetical protein
LIEIVVNVKDKKETVTFRDLFIDLFMFFIQLEPELQPRQAADLCSRGSFRAPAPGPTPQH